MLWGYVTKKYLIKPKRNVLVLYNHKLLKYLFKQHKTSMNINMVKLSLFCVFIFESINRIIIISIITPKCRNKKVELEVI